MLPKIIQTGMVLSALLLVPGAMRGVVDPPTWVKVFILVAGILGLVVAFIGLLVLIWA